ncbi:CD63 antigen-like [Daphnia pulex]|uniref:CD63 antigen-like n=1 Tax=Daphnia pulex TaxID=6669 RepID=UPI001EE060E5|nr:CD63 antigen-like [Daphnia pulex]
METGMKFIKYLLFIFNLLFAVSGITLIITAAVIQGLYSTYLDFLGNEFLSAPMLFIIVGVVIFLVAFFGCCGAVRENNCMMITFSVFLAVIFICELAGGIAAYVLRNDVDVTLTENMYKAQQQYNVTGHEGVTETWNIMQNEVHCCGVKNYSDWANTTFSHGINVPDSCCKEYTVGCGSNMILSPDADERLWTVGCVPELAEQVKHKAGVFAGIGVGIAFIQLIGIVFACLLAKAIRGSYHSV